MPIPNSKIVFGKALADDLFSEVAKEKSYEIFQAGLDQRGNQSKNKSTPNPNCASFTMNW